MRLELALSGFMSVSIVYLGLGFEIYKTNDKKKYQKKYQKKSQQKVISVKEMEKNVILIEKENSSQNDSQQELNCFTIENKTNKVEWF